MGNQLSVNSVSLSTPEIPSLSFSLPEGSAHIHIYIEPFSHLTLVESTHGESFGFTFELFSFINMSALHCAWRE